MLSACVECGKPVAAAGRVAFGLASGGVLCSGCRVGKTQVVSISAGVVRTLERLADPDRQAWQRMEVDARSFGELRGVLNHYLVHLLGKKPRMHEYLGLLGN